MDGVRTSETIQINIIRAKHIRGIKSELNVSYVKAEFDGRIIGESTRVESSIDSPAEYNYTTHIDCSLTEEGGKTTVDDIASKPLMLTFIEVLPKEKKQKEEKIVLLGQCSIDIFPILHGTETQYDQSYQIYPIILTESKSTTSNIANNITERVGYSANTTNTPIDSNEEVKPEVDIRISVNQPLIDEDVKSQTNFMTVKIGSAYSLPESWTTPNQNYNYVIGFPMLQAGNKEGFTLVQNGIFKFANDKELQKKPMKWNNVSSSAPEAQFIPYSFLKKPPPIKETGDVKDQMFCREAENEKNRVTWDIEKRFYFDPETKTSFLNNIKNNRFLPVEIMRVTSNPKASGGGKKDKNQQHSDDDGQTMMSYHGVSYVDFSPLLYPGVASVSGAFRVYPYSETEMEKKTLRKTQMAEEVIRAGNQISKGAPTPNQQRSKGPTNKRSTAWKEGKEHLDADVIVLGSPTDSAAYCEAKTYIYIQFTLHRPLIPRKQPDELTELVSQLIPPRPVLKMKIGGANQAVSDFHSQITSISHLILDEFQNLFGKQMADNTFDECVEEQIKRKKQLHYVLNTSGKYFAFKEQLKHSIVKIVREKFLKTSVFSSQEALQQFLTELYVYLIDEMHICIGKFLTTTEAEANVTVPHITVLQLKLFAEEAADNGDFEIAASYYKERILRTKEDPISWYDYGVFHFRNGNTIKSKECFKEAISIRQDFLEALIMYAIVCTIESDFQEAEIMFEKAVSISTNENQAILAWTMIGLFYKMTDNQVLLEHSFLEANRIALSTSSTISDGLIDVSEEIKKDENGTTNETYAKSEAEGLSKRVTKSASSLTLLSRNSKGKTETKPSTKQSSSVHMKSAKDDSFASDEPFSNCSDRKVMNEEEEDPNIIKNSIFMKAADWLLERYASHFTELALARQLLLRGPSSGYYILLARLQMIQTNFCASKESIEKAIEIDVENPEAWAICGHLSYETGDQEATQDYYERTISFVNDPPKMHIILLRLGEIYLDKEEYLKAKDVYLMACRRQPTCLTWLGVGTACYRLNELSEAEDALAEANVLNNTNALVWAYLTLVTLKTKRKLESEQCFKYASKLGLECEDLLIEINELQKECGFGNPSFNV